MLRALVLVVLPFGCAPAAPVIHPRADTPAVLLRYRLREGERYFTEVRMARASMDVVVRWRADVATGLRLRNEVLDARAYVGGRAATDLAGADVADQRVTPDRREVVVLGGESDALLGPAAPALPAGAITIGRSWESFRRTAGAPGRTTTRLRQTLVSLDGRTAVIALRGVMRTELGRSEAGEPRAVVSILSGERRIEVANAWVGRTEVQITTSLREGAGRDETLERVERTRFVLRVSRAPFADFSQ